MHVPRRPWNGGMNFGLGRVPPESAPKRTGAPEPDCASTDDRGTLDRSLIGACLHVTTNALPRRIAHLDMDAFYASVEPLRYPELRGLPVVIGGRRDQQPTLLADSTRRFTRLRVRLLSFRAELLAPMFGFQRGGSVRMRLAGQRVSPTDASGCNRRPSTAGGH